MKTNLTSGQFEVAVLAALAVAVVWVMGLLLYIGFQGPVLV